MQKRRLCFARTAQLDQGIQRRLLMRRQTIFVGRTLRQIGIGVTEQLFLAHRKVAPFGQGADGRGTADVRRLLQFVRMQSRRLQCGAQDGALLFGDTALSFGGKRL